MYKEYAEIIDTARPDVFVMENVVGIGSAKSLGGELIYPKIIERLKYLKDSPSKDDEIKYELFSLVMRKDELDVMNDKHFKITASNFGVPQHRSFIIIIGVRADKSHKIPKDFILDRKKFPSPSVKDTIETLPAIRSYIQSIR